MPNAPCSVQMITPSGLPAVDGNGAIVETAPVAFTTDGSGAFSQAVDYPGDYQSAYQNSKVRLTLNGFVIDSPIGFSYASSIAASTWIGAPSTAGLVTMRVVYTGDNSVGVGGVLLSVSLSQAAVVTATGAVAAGSAQPVLALTASDGTATFSLNPTSLLTPNTLVYELDIAGEQRPFFFTVPTVVDVYRGAYNNAATYSAASGSSNGDVVVSAGVLYRFINVTPSAGHAPPNGTYWAVVAGLPTDLITGYLQPGATTGVLSVQQSAIPADTAVATGSYAVPPVSLLDQLRQLTQLKVRRVTAATDTATYDDDVLELDGASNVVAQTLPTAVGWTKILFVKAIDVTHAVTVVGTGGQTLEGAGTLTPILNQVYALVSDNANWRSLTYALPAATTGVRGGVRPDGTTITIAGDVISAAGGGGGGGGAVKQVIAPQTQTGDNTNVGSVGSFGAYPNTPSFPLTTIGASDIVRMELDLFHNSAGSGHLFQFRAKLVGAGAGGTNYITFPFGYTNGGVQFSHFVAESAALAIDTYTCTLEFQTNTGGGIYVRAAGHAEEWLQLQGIEYHN